MVKNTPDIKEYEDQIYHCTRCGLCQSVCPVFDALKTELAVARGKVALMQGYLANKLEYTPVLAKYMELCTGCNACKEACPSGISSDKIFLRAREISAEKYGLSLPKKAIVNAFRSESALSFFSTLLHFYTYSKADFITDMVPDSVPFINKIKLLNAQLNGKTTLKLNKINIKQTKPAFKVIYFPGCINKYVNPSVAEATIELLKNNNTDVIVPDDLYCCGMPALMSGARSVAESLAEKNLVILDKLLADDFDYILVDCGSCSYMLKFYQNLFENTPHLQDLAEKINHKIIDLNQFLLQLDLNLPESKENITVTYHDPCHLRRSQNIYKEPRELIKSIRGLQYVEMTGADTCCGAAGSFCMTHMKLSNQISEKKAENILLTGADIVLTSCPSCKIGLTQGLISKHENKTTLHPVELIYRLIKQKKS
jgi:glycolate oxidase iron-sulfur subunit